jgi:hypothetical protein
MDLADFVPPPRAVPILAFAWVACSDRLGLINRPFDAVRALFASTA